jgi:hypothetical protein
LLQCYQARENIKAQIYEITGISDIIRGASHASETATAQQIKGQYAGLRLGAMQEDVALFASELLRLKSQIICSKFQPQTILAYAAASQMQPADQQLIPQALQLLQDKPLRNFRIEVAADSLVQLDENQNKQDRLAFLQAFGGFMSQTLPVAQSSPEMVPMLAELLRFGIGAFKQIGTIEGALDQGIEQLKAQQGQPQPDPEAQKAQAMQQSEQAKMQAQMQADQQKAQIEAQTAQAQMQATGQLEQAKMQMQVQVEQIKAQAASQLEAQKQQHEAQMQSQELAQREQFDRWKAELDAATKIMVAQIGKADITPSVDIAEQAASDHMVVALGNNLHQAMSSMADTHSQTMQRIGDVMSAMQAPKRIVRGPDGRAESVEVVGQQPAIQPQMVS